MAARSLASLTLSFGLVNIPVKLYSATESSATVKFNMLTKDGSRVKQQYISVTDGKLVERADMVKGYEFDKDQFVVFTPEELKVLDESPSHVVEIVAFVPVESVDPIFYDKAYFLAPDKRGAKPYALLMAAMRKSGLCGLARWNWKGKQYVVQLRFGEDGLVLQQLLYAQEVRSQKELEIEKADISPAELTLALQLIDQIKQDAFDPSAFQDNEKKRILAAIDEKIAGKQIVAPVAAADAPPGGQVIDLMDALRASLSARPAKPAKTAAAAAVSEAEPLAMGELKQRKPLRRAPKSDEPLVTPASSRARK